MKKQNPGRPMHLANMSINDLLEEVSKRIIRLRSDVDDLLNDLGIE